jgi:predicted nucleotidyltransferase
MVSFLCETSRTGNSAINIWKKQGGISMAVDYEAAKRIIYQYVSDVKAMMPIDKVYLYGSYANGTARWDSDVDLCFFSESFTIKNTMQIIDHLFKLKRPYNKYVCLEPNAFPLSELINDNPFVKEILRTGTEIIT